MDLIETELHILVDFIHNESADEITKKYLILYNFAADCRYAEFIQTELILYLLPFYLKTLASVERNKIASDVSGSFNDALFVNQRAFKNALGEEKFCELLEFYDKTVLESMGRIQSSLINWIPLFNVTVALEECNVQRLFEKIFNGSLSVKYSFFEYLSILLFKERDNIIVDNHCRLWWTNCIWNFDSWIPDCFFWRDETIKYFDEAIRVEKIRNLFDEISPMLINKVGIDYSKLIFEEMENSFTKIFEERKAEFLEKINNRLDEKHYWYDY